PETDIGAALDKGELKFRLDGFKLKGSWVLVHTGKREDARRWLLIKHRDEWAGPLDITEAAPLSIVTQGDFADILAADDPAIWRSHQPAKSGATGKMFADVIAQAVERRLANQAKPPRKRRSG